MNSVGRALWKIQIFEYGMWFPCTDVADNLEDAINLAKSLCSFLDDGNNVRILCPNGKIL